MKGLGTIIDRKGDLLISKLDGGYFIHQVEGSKLSFVSRHGVLAEARTQAGIVLPQVVAAGKKERKDFASIKAESR